MFDTPNECDRQIENALLRIIFLCSSESIDRVRISSTLFTDIVDQTWSTICEKFLTTSDHFLRIYMMKSRKPLTVSVVPANL